MQKLFKYKIAMYFNYATRLDKCLAILGAGFSILTGICAGLFAFTTGKVTGVIIAYAKAVNATTSKLDEERAADALLNGVTLFVIQNCVLGVISWITSYFAIALFSWSALRQICNIRLLYLDKMLNHDISWYDLNQSADFVSRMTVDLKRIEEGIGEKLSLFIISIAQCISCLLISLITGLNLTLIGLIPAPFGIAFVLFFSWVSKKYTKREMEAYGEADAVAEEVFSAIKTVVAFGGQPKEKERYDKLIQAAKDNNIKRSFLVTTSFVLMLMILHFNTPIIFWYGLKLLAEDQSPDGSGYCPENVVTILICSARAIYGFLTCISYLDVICHARGAHCKVKAVLNSSASIATSKGRRLDKLEGNIVFQYVDFSYPSRPGIKVLQGLTLKIKAGETVAVVGSSGCGKSTCIQLLQRFYDPTSGDIYIDDINVKELDPAWLRARIGVVSQEPILFEATIAENIKLGCEKTIQKDVENAAKKAYAHTFIKSLPLGYNTLVGERGVQLSGGQRQRIAIARALIRKPSILLLDEATSALDAHSEALVQIAMDLASMGSTTIIVAHRLSTIRRAKRILVLADGRIREDGTHDKLMTDKGMYYHLVASQTQSVKVDRVSDIQPCVTEENCFKAPGQSKIMAKAQPILEKPMSTYVHFFIKICCPALCYIIIGFITSALSGTGLPLFGLLYGQLIAAFIDGDVIDVHWALVIFIMLWCSFRTLCRGIQNHILNVGCELLSMSLRSRLFEAILSHNPAWFDREDNGVGALRAQLSAETDHVQRALGMQMGLLINGIVTIFAGFAIGFYLEWRLALTSACFLPVVLVGIYFNQRFVRKEDFSNRQSLQRSLKIAAEAISNIRTVASLGCQKSIYKLYASEVIPDYNLTRRNALFKAILYDSPRHIIFFATAACMYHGAILIKHHGVEPFAVFATTEIIILGLWFLGIATSFATNIRKGLMASRKIFQLLTCDLRKETASGTYHQVMVQSNVKFENVHFAYPSRPTVEVLKGVDLSLLQGKTVALVGSTGSGKSTIIQLLLRFYDYTHGNITIDQQNIENMNLRHLRSCIGTVFQEPHLFSRTIAENIAYGDNTREVGDEEIILAAKRANIHTFISALPLGYHTKLGEGIQLSGGQKQRIAIARALIRNPTILLLDEATSALDSENETVVQEALDDAKKGRTCIVIAHRLSTVKNADVICTVNQGSIVEMGTHSELMNTKGFYFNLHCLQGTPN